MVGGVGVGFEVDFVVVFVFCDEFIINLEGDVEVVCGFYGVVGK